MARAARYAAPEPEIEEVLGLEDVLSIVPIDSFALAPPPTSGVRMADPDLLEALNDENLSFKVYTSRTARPSCSRVSDADLTSSVARLRAAPFAMPWKKVAVRAAAAAGTLLTLLFLTLTLAELSDGQKSAGSAVHVAKIESTIPAKTLGAVRANVAALALAPPEAPAAPVIEADAFDALEMPAAPIKKAKHASPRTHKGSRLAVRVAPF